MLLTCIEQATVVINDSRLKRLADDGNKRSLRLLEFLDGSSGAFRAGMQFANTLLVLGIGMCAMSMYLIPLSRYFSEIGMGQSGAFFL